MSFLLKYGVWFLLLTGFSPAKAQLYVATTGSDTAEGSKTKPLASVAMALRKAREWRRLQDDRAKNGIRILVGGGVYAFSEPLFLRPEDAGTGDSPTTIEAVTGEQPVFSGGVVVKGWRKSSGAPPGLSKKAAANVWIAPAPVVGGQYLDFRQLWVNSTKAIRAKSTPGETMNRILSWDKKSETCWIPKPAVVPASMQGIEFFIHQWWAIAILRVRSMEVKGDSALLHFYQPESRIQSEHPWPSPWISSETGNSAFYLSNAPEFLDEPGEWYLDHKTHQLYYWPRLGEDLNRALVVAPALETLVKAEGTAERPLAHVRFRGIAFQHTTWMLPSQQGLVPLQAGMYLVDAYQLRQPGTPEKATLENQAWVGRPASAVKLQYANNLVFDNCRFEHTASTALDAEKGVKNLTVNGNLFNDIGGSAIVAGVFSDEAMEAHLPYNPADVREVTEGVTISNNVVHNAATEDWGCLGIAAGFVRNSTIRNNDLSELPYSGISLGWGWTKNPSLLQNNKVVANKISRYARQLYDVAGIYTLSAQPNTVITGNVVDSLYKAPYAHLPHHWFYLYTDEGSSFITVKNNWTPSEKFLQNANGPGNQWTTNGPMVADSIRTNAGVEPPYQFLLQERTTFRRNQPINHNLPVVVELVGKNGETPAVATLKKVLAEEKVGTSQLYLWQNHVVLFDRVGDASVLRTKLEKAFPDVQVNIYDTPFYEFNRQHCADTTTIREWDHVLLTADLVADPRLQKEYLDEHATQFQKWPEVSVGFCKAGFQQLLVYKNGRRLMLVITLPKGRRLEELNPKTTENNPRMVEWNNLMKKYQTGIAGTKPGEVWVFFNKLRGE